VYHVQAFESELERRRMAGIGTVDMFPPLYLCNWSYDARLGKFMAWNQETQVTVMALINTASCSAWKAELCTRFRHSE
jgi:hypothetical protein